MSGKRPSEFWAEIRDWYQTEITKERADYEAMGRAQSKTLKKARDKKAEKRGYGSKDDEPRVKKAQELVDRINAAAKLWAKGDRTQSVQVIKDLIANGRASEQTDGSVIISRDAMLSQVSYEGGPKDCHLPYRDGGNRLLPYGTLREWADKGHLKRVPAAQKKNKK